MLLAFGRKCKTRVVLTNALAYFIAKLCLQKFTLMVAKISQSCLTRVEVNALAYFNTELIMALKGFIA